MRLLALIFILQVSGIDYVHAQFQDKYWCFGDSAAINFNPVSPISGSCILRTRGTCASICDSTGNLLFYAGSPNWNGLIAGTYPLGIVVNKFNQIVGNGDSLNARTWYQEMTIIPDPGNSSQFYVFHIGVTQSLFPGIFYSKVDLSLNGGLGQVIQKNVQLQNFTICDGITAVKHGNGRDWWVLFRRWDTFNNDFYVYLVTPQGISSPSITSIGSHSDNGFLRMKFSKSGNMLLISDTYNLIETFSFDRCTGSISNPQTIVPRNITPTSNQWSLAISPDETKIYTTDILNGNNSDTSYLFQYDLNDTNVALSKDTLYTFVAPVSAGLLNLGPDGRIYLSCIYAGAGTQFSYLYADSMYNTYNTNISVINNPDSLGMSCNFLPFSFYLGGHRSYMGLPNNPNYELGPMVGSICDTITSVAEILSVTGELLISPNPANSKIWINARMLTGGQAVLRIHDILGRELLHETENIYSGYVSTSIDITCLPKAHYLISIETEKIKLVRRFIKN